MVNGREFGSRWVPVGIGEHGVLDVRRSVSRGWDYEEAGSLNLIRPCMLYNFTRPTLT